MNSISSASKTFTIIVCAISIVQGTVWAALSLLAIIIHTEEWVPEFRNTSYVGTLSSTMVKTYITDRPTDGVLDVFLYVSPTAMYVWTIIYFIASTIWVLISLCQLCMLYINKPSWLKKCYLSWANWTGLICICDIIFSSLMISDYESLIRAINKSDKLLQSSHTFTVLSCGILSLVAARGFLLWIINMTFCLILTKFWRDMS